MKPPCFPIFASFLLAAIPAAAQTNIFPASGNVGIGTTTPGTNLEVVGAVRTSGTNPTISIHGSGFDILQWCNTGDPTDQKYTEFIEQSGAFTGRFVNDAYSLSSNWLYVTRASGSYPAQSVCFPNGNVGIGTTTPQQKLQVSGTGRFGTDANGYVDIYSTATEGGTINLRGCNGSNMYLEGDNGFFRILNSNFSAQLFRVDQNGNVYIPGNVGIGTMNPTYPLSVNGTIEAKEVIVQTGWSDFVFSPSYRLAPLSEVETVIKAAGHLPGIPSQAEVSAKGVNVGDMQAKLLEKVEELTLYVIAQDKRIQKIEEENRSLRSSR